MKNLELPLCMKTPGSGALGALCVGILACTSAPVSANEPAHCAWMTEAIGIPQSNMDERPGDFHEVPICHDRFLLRHNNLTKTPDWVIERLTADLVTGTNTRPKVKFQPEPNISDDNVRADDEAYLRSQYARGHQAASADFKSDEQLMKNTFIFSNAVPQEGSGFNSSIWSQFENRVQKLAQVRGEIYVITGPVYQDPKGKDIVFSEAQNPCGREIRLPDLERDMVCGGLNKSTPNLKCDGHGVAIPAGLYKIIYDPAMNRINAYVMPNVDHPNKKERGGLSTENYLNTWRISVRNLEDRVGYTFFPDFDRHRSHALLESCPASMIR
ncbi:DNA/RNA non-specific endonuclease [Roseibium sp.]|uniref:DNA/RNA non-specific endonuclease n=1 Tax=Roseibium sp. TaxID=1936156 RepID=UPI003D11DD16